MDKYLSGQAILMKDLYAHLPHLYVFVTVVECGSFQAAARRLELPRSSVSKRVAQLEQQLGLRLLQRSTRRLNLTAEGKALLDAASPLLPAVQRLSHLTQESQLAQGQLTGHVVITSSTLLGERFLIPLLSDVKQAFPGVVVELRLNDEVVDLIADGVDLALRIGKLPDSSLVARQIGIKRWGCLASPNYLARHPAPQTPYELAEHQCIVLKTSTYRLDHWSFQQPGGDSFQLKISESSIADDGRTLVAMASSGMGVIWGDPAWVKAEIAAGKLTEILQDWRSNSESPIHWVSLGRQARNPAVEAVWQFLGERLGERLEERDCSKQ